MRRSSRPRCPRLRPHRLQAVRPAIAPCPELRAIRLAGAAAPARAPRRIGPDSACLHGIDSSRTAPSRAVPPHARAGCGRARRRACRSPSRARAAARRPGVRSRPGRQRGSQPPQPRRLRCANPARRRGGIRTLATLAEAAAALADASATARRPASCRLRRMPPGPSAAAVAGTDADSTALTTTSAAAATASVAASTAAVAADTAASTAAALFCGFIKSGGPAAYKEFLYNVQLGRHDGTA